MKGQHQVGCSAPLTVRETRSIEDDRGDPSHSRYHSQCQGRIEELGGGEHY